MCRDQFAHLRRKIFVELMPQQNKPPGQMRDLNGLRLETRLQLRVGKRIPDGANLNSDIGIRQESRGSRLLSLRRSGSGRLFRPQDRIYSELGTAAHG